MKGQPVTAITKLASDRWKKLGEDEKKVFQEEYEKKKAEYEEAKKSYVPLPSAENEETEKPATRLKQWSWVSSLMDSASFPDASSFPISPCGPQESSDDVESSRVTRIDACLRICIFLSVEFVGQQSRATAAEQTKHTITDTHTHTEARLCTRT